jgi:hypothetical protein
VKVRATVFGEYRGKRKPGDEFEFEGKPSGKWMEPVDDAARAAFEAAGIKVASKPVPPPSFPTGETTLAGDAVEPHKKTKAEARAEAEAEAKAEKHGSTGDKNVI